MNTKAQAKEVLEELSKTGTEKTKVRKPVIRKRIDAVIENLPHNNYAIYPSAIQSGYAHNTAKNTPALKNTISRRLKELEEQGIELPQDNYFNLRKLMEEYEFITTQRKDLGTKLKAITPILQKHRIIPSVDLEQQSIPPLIIGIRELNIGVDKGELGAKTPSNEPISVSINPDSDTKTPQKGNL